MIRASLGKSALAPALLMAVLPLAAATPAQAQDAAVRRLTATPSALALRVGETAEVRVRALDAAGAEVDAAVRLVGPRRALRVRGTEVEALEPGEHELVATAAGPGGQPVVLRIPVAVSWPAVVRVEVAAPAGPLYAGTAVEVGAEALHADGSRRPEPRITWRSSDPSVATVDAFGGVVARAPGRVVLTASAEGVEGSVTRDVAANPVTALRIEGGLDEVRTGDVQRFTAVATDASGRTVPGVALSWTLDYRPAEGVVAPSAPGRLRGGAFVADEPGVYTVVADAGTARARRSFRVVPRDVVQELEVTGHGLQSEVRTTDFWVFEGRDGRDYVITGSKVGDGHAYVFDVTDPTNIVKTDSVQVDARAVNDVKVSPDARYATMTREGASNRRNGVVILDLADPAHPVIASEVTENLTGGVHNAFPTETHVFALSNGDKYVILDVADIYAPRQVSEYDHPDSRVHDVWVHDGLAYSAEWETGIVVVDVGNGRWGGSIENPVFVTAVPLPSGSTHAVFPYVQPSTGKLLVFAGDEDMSRAGRAWAGYPRSMGSYADRYDPERGIGGIPLTTEGYIQVVDFSDPENPEMVARYEVSEYGTHNIWVEDEKLYQAYYEGGVRIVDVSGELMGNLYTQDREIAVFKSATPAGYTPNATMVWSAMPHKGFVFFSDTNSGVWAVKLVDPRVPVS